MIIITHCLLNVNFKRRFCDCRRMVSNLNTSNYSKYSTDVILKTTAMHARNDISFQFMLYLARNVQSDNLKRLNHNIDVDVDVNIVNQA